MRRQPNLFPHFSLGELQTLIRMIVRQELEALAFAQALALEQELEDQKTVALCAVAGGKFPVC